MTHDTPHSTPSESANTPESADVTLYAKHQKIHPRRVFGLFSTLKILSVIILLGIYYITPWLLWNGQQAVLLDLPTRKFHILGLTFWPQDLIYLAFLLIIAGISLFFFTTLAGRLWCGFACPQTVWTDIFLWMERWVEGDRPKRIKLDKSPTSLRKIRIKATKHLLWITFALFTGFTFIGYFSPIRELATDLVHFNLSGWQTFWLLFYSLATYGNAGWLREQVCIYMCPYARFQSAMFDKDTLIIAYDPNRGEPRGPRKKTDDYKQKGLGDCVQCTLCIQVCPTGIDIRDGLQYQCISCSACIDVCNEVMDKMGYPRGLVRYTTENILTGKTATHVFRPRVFVYGGILLSLFIGTGYAIANRPLLELDVIRDRNSLFRENEAGLIENVYTLKVINIDKIAHEYQISAKGIEGLQIKTHRHIQAQPGEVQEIPVRLLIHPEQLKQPSSKVYFTLTALDNPSLHTTEEARFLGPFNR